MQSKEQNRAKPLANLPCLSDIMTREVVCLFPHQSFSEALTILARNRFRHLPVIDTDAHPLGLLSARDLLRTWTHTPQPDGLTVRQIIEPQKLPMLHVGASVSAAQDTMIQHRVNCVPIVDDSGRLCGIVTVSDLLRSFIPGLTVVGRSQKHRMTQRKDGCVSPHSQT